MVEATQTLPSQPSRVLICLARLAAKEAIKQQLRDQGLKPQYIRIAEINRAAGSGSGSLNETQNI